MDHLPAQTLSTENATKVQRLHVLALDSSPVQTIGAQRRLRSVNKYIDSRKNVAIAETEAKDTVLASNEVMNRSHSHQRNSLTHRTAYIGAKAKDDEAPQNDSLVEEIDEWLCSVQALSGDATQSPGACDEQTATPLLLVALHACGSLTPTILRSALAYRLPSSAANSQHRRYIAAAIIVGCCYNLLEAQGSASAPLCQFGY